VCERERERERERREEKSGREEVGKEMGEKKDWRESGKEGEGRRKRGERGREKILVSNSNTRFTDEQYTFNLKNEFFLKIGYCQSYCERTDMV
jgi:hypothetical protein